MAQAAEKSEKSKHAELMELYSDSEACDKDLFPEQKSNVLLIAGEHYTKRGSAFNQIRARSDIPQEQRIRLTKNHIQKISKIYTNNIVSGAPGVMVAPNNEKDLQNRKAADLRQSLWLYAKKKYRLKEKIREWAGDYVGIGEVVCKIFWDPNAGEFKGYAQETDDAGNPVFVDAVGEDTISPQDETGQPHELKPGKRAVFSGDFVFDTYQAFNMLRSPQAKNMIDSPYLILRKMASIVDLKALVGNDEEKMKLIQEESDKTYVVFDAQRAQYSKVKGQAMLRECYYRPCIEYPMGYFYLYTEKGILAEGELPFGVFPIAYAGFERIQTSPRARSPVKHMRPYQAEINRSASKMAEHQITLGDDKIVYSSGSKLEYGGVLPGIRGVKVSGANPTILAGRDGSQYMNYMTSQITELYQVMSVDESVVDAKGELDPYALIFRSASKKKVFSEYIERFEQFLTDVCEIFLELAPHYFTDQMMIPMVGKQEYVNLSEIRGSEPMGYSVKLETVSDDIETQMGQQLIMNQALQYAAGQLSKEDIGIILRNMPFARAKDVFRKFTLDSDLTDNIILALDRGQPHQAHEYDNNPYILAALLERMRQPDFNLLSPQAQQNYYGAVNAHEQAEAAKQAKIMAAKNEYIPVDGAKIVCDLYVADPKDPNKSARVKIPYASLNWLIKQLELQGTSIDALDNVPAPVGPNIAIQAGQMAGHQRQGMPTQGASQPVQPTGGGNMPVMPGQE